jgi:hypothetical protein
MKKVLFALTGIIGAVVAILLPSSVQAASFNAGNIIGDGEFTDANSMSVNDVQNFLNSKNSACLKNYVTQEPLGNNTYGGNVSAARAIWKAGQLFGINPKVLLVTLQKEQGLITRTDCPSWRYQTALGYGCPDTAPCSTFGFSVQLYQGARHFRGFFDQNAGWYIPYTPGVRYIQYNPDPGCGGSNVNIQNRATASLYSYTPYQPNAATLGVPIGQTAPCGAYGNKNFWHYYNAWFKITPFFQLPGSVRTYMMGANNTYYYIESAEAMTAYGYGSRFGDVDQRANNSGLTFRGNLPLIARFEEPGVYIIDGARKNPFPSEAVFYNYGYEFGEEATLPKWVQDHLSTGSSVNNILKLSTSATAYSIEGGKKRPFCNEPAFTQLGSPTYATRPSIRLSGTYAKTIADGAPLAVEGDLIRSSNTNQYGVWQAGTYTPMESAVASGTGAVNCGVSATAVNQLPKAPSTIGSLVKNSSGNTYVINRSNKLTVGAAAADAYGIETSSAHTLSTTLLNKLSTQSLKTVVRVNSGAGVYDIRDGKSHPIPSETDFYGLGYSFANVQNVTQSTFSLASKGGYIFAPARVVRERNSSAVYLVNTETMQKHAFTSEQAFHNYGYAWNQVLVVNAGGLSSYSTGAPINAYIRENDGSYWLMSRGVKRRISPSLAGSAFFDVATTATPLSASVLSRFPMADPVTKVFRAENGIGVYLIENGRKRAFASESALLSRSYSWSEVRVLSSYFVSSLPSGPSIR